MASVKHWVNKLSLIGFFLCIAGLGGFVGSKISTKRYPVTFLERSNLTPAVAPGDALLLAQSVSRADQCDVTVKRVISTADGQRFSVKQEFESGFGPLGGDKYILPVSTPRTAPLGDATMYSKAYSWCNLLDYIVGPSEAEPHVLQFRFADTTILNPIPAGFERMKVKPIQLGQ